MDDGTGSANVLLGLAAPQPGVDISGAKVGDYVLVIGKVVAKQHGGRQQLYIKPHKVGAGPPLATLCPLGAGGQRALQKGGLKRCVGGRQIADYGGSASLLC